MNIDKQLLDNLTAQAQESPRLRMNYDLRDSAEDLSQMMLNALEPGTVLPIHRHRATSETVVILRGRAVQWLYDEQGNVTGKVLLAAGVCGCHGDPDVSGKDDMTDAVPAMQVEKGQWHRLEALESGTVIVEFKNGSYEPIVAEDILKA